LIKQLFAISILLCLAATVPAQSAYTLNASVASSPFPDTNVWKITPTIYTQLMGRAPFGASSYRVDYAWDVYATWIYSVVYNGTVIADRVVSSETLHLNAWSNTYSIAPNSFFSVTGQRSLSIDLQGAFTFSHPDTSQTVYRLYGAILAYKCAARMYYNPQNGRPAVGAGFWSEPIAEFHIYGNP
jgi:hypothetical protein